jgi:hypothetical protein
MDDLKITDQEGDSFSLCAAPDGNYYVATVYAGRHEVGLVRMDAEELRNRLNELLDETALHLPDPQTADRCETCQATRGVKWCDVPCWGPRDCVGMADDG